MLGRLEVDYKLELRWLLYGKVARLRALEDLVYISGGSAIQMLTIRAVGHEATSTHKSTLRVYRRQPFLGRELKVPVKKPFEEQRSSVELGTFAQPLFVERVKADD